MRFVKPTLKSNWFRLLWGAVLVFLFWSPIYRFFYPAGSVNIRMTVIVDDNGRDVSGSTVVQFVGREEFLADLIGQKGVTYLLAQVVRIDLGEKGLLFVTPLDFNFETNKNETKSFSIEHMFVFFNNDFTNKIRTGNITNAYRLVKSIKNLPNSGYTVIYEDGDPKYLNNPGSKNNIPLMFGFTDRNDFRSMRNVWDGELGKVFGDGVRLKKMTLEITDDPMTSTPLDDLLPGVPGTEALVIAKRTPPYEVPATTPAQLIENWGWAYKSHRISYSMLARRKE